MRHAGLPDPQRWRHARRSPAHSHPQAVAQLCPDQSPPCRRVQHRPRNPSGLHGLPRSPGARIRRPRRRGEQRRRRTQVQMDRPARMRRYQCGMRRLLRLSQRTGPRRSVWLLPNVAQSLSLADGPGHPKSQRHDGGIPNAANIQSSSRTGRHVGRGGSLFGTPGGGMSHRRAGIGPIRRSSSRSRGDRGRWQAGLDDCRGAGSRTRVASRRNWEYRRSGWNIAGAANYVWQASAQDGSRSGERWR
mmetsp:Transcript_6977/g.15280  ORF Transcript_6977/g.15280 Transcript_6977/m.15280 type:complete len:246 (+) Transcript_6977:37-774(+)